MTHSTGIDDLLQIMKQLRDPEKGCPWDARQTYETIAPYTIEEAYEVDDAIRKGDIHNLREELGDLLLQVVFQSQIATERGDFNFQDVVQAIIDKMTRRHPHVFGEETYKGDTAFDLTWEEQKRQERTFKTKNNEDTSLLDDIPQHFPALMRAQKMQKRAAQIGFDWDDISAVRDKIDEEMLELQHAIDSDDTDSVLEEFGDLLFVIVNLGRHLKVDSETALRHANEKFKRRFKHVETKAKASGKPAPYSLEQLESFWQEAKQQT